MEPRPKATHFTLSEGGKWYLWAEQTNHTNIFAIKFEDGSIWDVYCGWRPMVRDERTKGRTNSNSG